MKAQLIMIVAKALLALTLIAFSHARAFAVPNMDDGRVFRSSENNLNSQVFRTPAPAPDTLQALWDQSVVVVRAQVLTRTIRLVTEGVRRPIELPHTENVLLIQEAYKMSEQVTGDQERLTLLTDSAHVERPGQRPQEVRGSGPILERGQEVIAFLRRDALTGAYRSTSSLVGVFAVRRGMVSIPSRAREYGEFAGASEIALDRFVNILRGLAGATSGIS